MTMRYATLQMSIVLDLDQYFLMEIVDAPALNIPRAPGAVS